LSVTELEHSFDDGPAYERFMGKWSRAAGRVFLDWLAAPAGVHWLEVGCGTGAFTRLISTDCSPASVTAVDPAEAQIAYACRQPVSAAEFRVAHAEALPFGARSFDLVVSALVINFITDRPRALAEMRRVARPGGTIAGYVWDFAADRSPSGPLRRALGQLGVELAPLPGAEASRLDALTSLFKAAGLDAISTTCFDVTVRFPDFDDFWQAQTPSYHPMAKAIARMEERDRAKLVDRLRADLAVQPGHPIEYSARANAIKARVPG
jgi:ubiquinone/menaquinone biosynthesis C-methylase UbiE